MGFSNPQGLFALGFLAVLVWLYLRERHQRAVEVSSLLLWRPVREESRRSRFSVDPLFVLQALLLAALGLGVARPWLETGAATVDLRRAVFVIDTSASMQTIEDGERRFDQARRQARDVLAAFDPGEEIMVVAVEARPRIVSGFSRDREVARRAVESLEPGDGPTRLALGIQLARSARGNDGGQLEIVVFTDLPRAELSAPLAAGERLRYFRYGRTDDNVAIAALRVYQNPFQEMGEARAYALVKNYSQAAKETRLHVSLGAREVLSETIQLGPLEGRAVPIRGLSEPGQLEARLEVADALAVDNRAIAYVRAARPIRLLVVSHSPGLSQDIRTLAEAVPAFELQEVAPDDFRDEMWRQSDVAIFHDKVPPGPMRTNALFVYPPAGNELFPVDRDVVGAQILDWNERHPVMRDLRYVEALPLEHARLVRAPDWTRTLISSRAGAEEFPLALAGERDGRRIVLFAFDLADRSVRKSENLSLLLLFLNALKWLTPLDPSQPIQVDIGDGYRETSPEPAAVVVTAPDGTREELSPRTEIAVDIDRRGQYRVLVGNREHTIYANLFDPEESSIGRDGVVGEERVEAGAAAPRAVRFRHLREYGWWLYAAAVLLVFAEWAFAMQRRSFSDA